MTRSSTPGPDVQPRRRGPALLRPTGPLLVAGLLLTTACGAPQDARPEAAAATGRAAAEQPVPHTGGHAGSGRAGVASAVSAATTASSAAADDDPVVALRGDLQRLLAAHVLLADEVVRGMLRGQDDQVTASTAAVGRNTDELVERISPLAGPAVGEQFRTAWDRHVEVLGQYATALEEQDTAGQRTAREDYAAVEQRLAQALSAVAGGKVPQADLTAAATAHGAHLLGQADAYAAKDYAKAYSLQREGFAHMIVVGDALARGVAATKGLPATELDAPRRNLNSELNRLLSEHMGLMVQALRSGHDQAPDFPAAGAALNGNTADLGSAISTLFGPAAGTQFLALWADHIEGLVQVAQRTDDPAAQRAGRQAQSTYAPALAGFLAGATQKRLPAIDLAAGLTVHDDHLLAMTDAYAEKDYEGSQQQADAGYAHMIEFATRLAVAIGDSKAAELPRGGAATGGGSTAGGH